MTRRLALEGIDNFRDYGDYPAAGGRRLKRGRLYRSAGHGGATDADLAVLAGLGIAVVVDLRRPGERARDPSRRHPEFRGVVLASDLPEAEEDAWQAHIRDAELSEASFRAYMFDYYRKAPFEPRHLEIFSRYFRALLEAEGPILIHCAAGKDRTGLLAALTHHLAGVAPADIIADYLLTNDPARLKRRLPMVIKAIADASGRTPSEAAVRVALGVEAAYLETAFAAIEMRFGSLDAYLERALGVDAAARARLRAILLD